MFPKKYGSCSEKRNRKREGEEKLKPQKGSIQKLWKKIEPQNESLKTKLKVRCTNKQQMCLKMKMRSMKK